MNTDPTPSPTQSAQPDSNASPKSAKTQTLPYPSCHVPQVPQGPVPEAKPKRVPQPRRYKPRATWTIVAINVALWLIMTAMGGSTNPYVLLRFGAKVNTLIVQGQIWRLVTPIFLHIGIVHLAFNSYAIWVIGPQIECFYGSARFLSIYLLSGIYGVLLSFAFSPNAAAGASGAIFGLIGTQASFFYRYKEAFGERGRRQFYSTLSVIAFNLVLTFAAPNIDIWGHVGGLLSGAVLGWGLMPNYAVAMTEQGPKMIDRNHRQQWSKIVLGAIVLLIASSWIAIIVQAGTL